MRRSIVLCLFLFSTLFLHSQEKFYSSGIGYVLFGDGDYSGINYYNSIQFPVLKSLDFKVGLYVANAAETNDEYYYNRHNVFNLANSYNLAITPVKTNLFRLTVSAGGIWRYRTEIVFRSSKTVYTSDGSSSRTIENDYNKSYDVGYNVDITALVKITERLYTGGCGQFIGYNKGSGLYSINLCFNYKL
jgi:hypothetical protein